MTRQNKKKKEEGASECSRRALKRRRRLESNNANTDDNKKNPKQQQQRKKIQHVFAEFISSEALYDYHKQTAKNDYAQSDSFVLVGGEGEDREDGKEVERQEAPAAAAAAAAAEASSSSLSTLLFERKASALMPLDAPRPLQIALGTSFIKIRLKHSVKVVRSPSSPPSPLPSPSPSPSPSSPSALPPIETVEFVSASALWVPRGSRDLPIGSVRVSASYELRRDEREGEKNAADAANSANAAYSANAANNASAAGRLPVVRFDVSAAADFRPEGFLVAFKVPLDAIMLSSLLKTAREMSSWFAATSAAAAGVGPPPARERIAAAVVDVGPRLPRELAYLRLRKLSVDGPPGESRGLSVEESDELARAAAEASERALALVLGPAWKEKGREPSLAAASAAAAKQEQKQEHQKQQHQPATPESKATKKSGATAPSASSSRSSSFSSVESFLSAASELPESGDDGPFDGGDCDNKPSTSQAAVAASVAAPPTPEKTARKSGNSSSRSISNSGRSPRRALRVPRWLTPQAKEKEAAGASLSSSSPSSSPSPSCSRPGSAPSLPEKPTSALPLFKKWLRPKSART